MERLTARVWALEHGFPALNLWPKKWILQKLFEQLAAEHDYEWLFIDGGIVKAHQDSTGAVGDSDEAIGGNSTKIHVAVDSGGLPVNFELSGGQVYDISHAQSLVEHRPETTCVTADEGYDSDIFRDYIEVNGGVANIPRKTSRKKGNDHMDWYLYKYRHLVENVFWKIK